MRKGKEVRINRLLSPNEFGNTFDIDGNPAVPPIGSLKIGV